MPLSIDLAAATRRLSDEEFFAWAQGQTVFLSSVMGELADERRAVASALEQLGVTVRWFEEFGGRDDSAGEAYLGEVRSATLYLGMLGDSYGSMLPSEPYAGYSATHAEYLEARANGKRISFWERKPADRREGHARSFLTEVQLFQVTGSFTGTADLPGKVEKRLRELAAEDLAPWVKVGDIIVRASHVQASTSELKVRARVYDTSVLRALSEAAGSGQGWARKDVQLTYANRSGTGHIEEFSESSTSAAFSEVEFTSKANWRSGRDMGTSISGYSTDDLTEVAMKVGLLGEAMPTELLQMSFMVQAEDPLAELETLAIPEGAAQPLSRLLVAEQLVGGRRADAVERFGLGPPRNHQRHVELSWWEPRRYSNVEPQLRSVSGVRAWG
jgi:Domain of unknown function (DUF4062)